MKPFEVSQRRALQDGFFPDWTVDAACRGDRRPNVTGKPGQMGAKGKHWPAAFNDDVAQVPPDQEYVWPSDVLEAMRVCSTCPVINQCREYAFAGIAAKYRRQFGVFAGLPGRMRERLCYQTCPDCTGTGFVPSVEIDGTPVPFARYAWAYPEKTPGFTCSRCGGHGAVLRPDRKERARQWFEAFIASRPDWGLDDTRNMTA